MEHHPASGKTGNLMAGIEDGQLVITALLGNRDNGALRREIRTGTARLATVVVAMLLPLTDVGC